MPVEEDGAVSKERVGTLARLLAMEQREERRAASAILVPLVANISKQRAAVPLSEHPDLRNTGHTVCSVKAQHQMSWSGEGLHKV